MSVVFYIGGFELLIHLGDIKKIDGHKIQPVDVVVAGSPCQNLSIAGDRLGLRGEQSGLFFQYIRVIREMRDEYRKQNKNEEEVRPRYTVFENVKGALSSPGGDQKGKDFRRILKEIIKIAEPKVPVLPNIETWPKAGLIQDELGKWSVAWRTVDAQYWGTPQRRERVSIVGDFNGLSAGQILFEHKTMQNSFERGQATEEDRYCACRRGDRARKTDINNGVRVVTLKRGGTDIKGVKGREKRGVSIQSNLSATIRPKEDQVIVIINKDKDEALVRRFMPDEYELLQGFPVGWTDIGEWSDSCGNKRQSSDNARFKVIGNSIAIPFWYWLLTRISSQYDRVPTLGSLFDGIGGFPYCWANINGVESCLWASEIDEFAIAVTEKHFGKHGDFNDLYRGRDELSDWVI